MFHHDTVRPMLAATPPFARFTRSELRTIGEKTTLRKILAGEMLTKQGQFGSELIVILNGTASVDVSGTVVAELGAGEVIGEMSLLDHGPRSATITATSPMELAVLGIKAFEDLTTHSLALWRAVATGLARRLCEEDRSYHN